jgi:hypothetical protein
MAQIDDRDPDGLHLSEDGEISALTEKSTPVAADKYIIEDSAAGDAKKYVTQRNLQKPLLEAKGDSGGAIAWDAGLYNQISLTASSAGTLGKGHSVYSRFYYTCFRQCV